MTNLDLKDRKILYQLDLNSRKSFAEIAKKVRLSKEVVQYRVKRLQDDGYINYFTTVIDSNKLGYISFRCFVKCQNLNLEKEKEIIDFLKPRVGWVVNVRGKWDFNIAVWKKNIQEFMSFWNDFYIKFSDIITDYTCNPLPTMWIYTKGWLLNNDTDSSECNIWGIDNGLADFDDIDRKILSLIVTSARMPSLEIAKLLKVTEGTIRQRLKKLEKEKIILRYSVFLDITKFDMHYFKLHFHVKNINEQIILKIREYAHLQPNIIFSNDAIGGHFLEFDLNVESTEKLYKIIDEFREKFPDVIKEYEFFEYIKEHKFEFLPQE